MKSNGRPREQKPAGDRSAGLSDAELVAAVERGDSAALDEFITRFGRLLFNRARRLGISRLECEDVVVRVIEDLAQRLMRGEIRIQSSVSAYIVRSFQREYARTAVRARTRGRALRERMHDPAGTGEGLVQGLCSEHTLVSSRGPGWEPPPVSIAVERLATMIEDDLTGDEERLLAWVSNEVDLGAMARELGLKYDTLAKRIRRLRERMRAAALRHAEHFGLEERRALVRFFTRADRLYEAAALSASIEGTSASPAAPIHGPGSGEDV